MSWIDVVLGWLADEVTRLGTAVPAAGTYVNGQSVVASVAVTLAFFGYRHTRASFKQKNSFDAQRRIISEKDIRAAFKHLSERVALIDAKEPVDSWEEISGNTAHEAVSSALTILNTFEDLAIGIKLKMFDERILRAALLTMLMRTFVLAGGFISERQKVYPRVYQHAQWLYARWGKKIFNFPSRDRWRWWRREVAFRKAISIRQDPIPRSHIADPGVPPAQKKPPEESIPPSPLATPAEHDPASLST